MIAVEVVAGARRSGFLHHLAGHHLDPGGEDDRDRAIDKLKAYRAVATSYGRRGSVLLGTVTDASMVIWPCSGRPGRLSSSSGSA